VNGEFTIKDCPPPNHKGLDRSRWNVRHDILALATSSREFPTGLLRSDNEEMFFVTAKFILVAYDRAPVVKTKAVY